MINHLLTDTIWALGPSAHPAVEAIQRTLLAGKPPSRTAMDKFIAAQKSKLRTVNGQVAVMPLHGVIEQHPTAMSYYFDGSSCTEFASALQDNINNPNVSAIVMHVDSPGGSSYGVEELSDM